MVTDVIPVLTNDHGWCSCATQWLFCTDLWMPCSGVILTKAQSAYEWDAHLITSTAVELLTRCRHEISPQPMADTSWPPSPLTRAQPTFDVKPLPALPALPHPTSTYSNLHCNGVRIFSMSHLTIVMSHCPIWHATLSNLACHT